jgi:hypothetical protein
MQLVPVSIQMGIDRTNLDAACPHCGGRPTVVIVRTLSGVYCHCESCDHLWYVEGITVDSPSGGPPHPRRRKRDIG